MINVKYLLFAVWSQKLQIHNVTGSIKSFDDN